MALDTTNPYFRTQVLTASPEELRMMLLEGSLRFLREGRDAIERSDHEAQYEAFTSAKNIILELIGSMKHEIAPELCAKLEGLYTYMYRTLLEAGFERDAAKVQEVIDLMEYERETWAMLMDRLSQERSAESIPEPGRSDQSDPLEGHRSRLSLEG